MPGQVSRRDVLKLLSLLSLSSLVDRLPGVEEKNEGRAQSRETPNILILVFDALSARQMSLYGYRRQTTPHLTAFAETAAVFHNHYAGGNFTTPGAASLLTGTYPWSHRALHFFGTVGERVASRNLFRAFAGGPYTRVAYTQNALAHALLRQFQDDIDIHIGPYEFSLGDGRFLEQIFTRDETIARRAEAFLIEGTPRSLFFSWAYETSWQAYVRSVNQQHADLYPRGVPESFRIFYFLDQVIAGLAATLRSVRQPFFAYLHLLPPHAPYRPRREFVGRFDDGWTPVAKKPHFFSKGFSDEELSRSQREYNEYTAYADAHFGQLYEWMKQSGLLDNTCLVFTSDHGEMFERGIFEHITPTLYEPIMRVPLLIARPGQKKREDVYTPTSCVDILPTVLQIAGRPVPGWCEGTLLPGFGGPDARRERSTFSVEAKSNPKQAPLTTGTLALVKGQYKLIHYLGYPGYSDEYELYDLWNDVEELEDLYRSRKSIAAALQDELEARLSEANQSYLS